MANFPIVRTTRQPTGGGPNVQIPQGYVDNSGEIIGNALSRLGGVAMDEAVKWNRLWSEQEVGKAVNQTTTSAIDLADKLDNDGDPTHYDGYYKEFEDTARQNRPQGVLAGRLYDSWWMQHQPGFKARVADAMKLNIAKSVKDKSESQMEKAISTGDLPLYEDALNGMVRINLISQEAAKAAMDSFPIDSTIEQLRQSAEVDPDASIAGLTSLLTRPDVTKKQLSRVNWAINIVQELKYSAKRREDDRWYNIANEVYGQARTMDFPSFSADLQQREDINEIEKAKLMQIYLGASKLWLETKENPWENTQDYPKLAGLIMDIQSGKIKDRSDIDAVVFEGGQPNVSFNHWRMAQGIWDSINKPDKETNVLTDPTGKVFFEMLAETYRKYRDENGVFVDRTKAEEYVAKLNMMRTAFQDKAIWGNSVKMREVYDGLVSDEKKEEAKGLLRWMLEGVKLPIYGYQGLRKLSAAEGQGAVENLTEQVGQPPPRQPTVPMGTYPTPLIPTIPPLGKSSKVEQGETAKGKTTHRVVKLKSHEEARFMPSGTKYTIPKDDTIYTRP